MSSHIRPPKGSPQRSREDRDQWGTWKAPKITMTGVVWWLEDTTLDLDTVAAHLMAHAAIVREHLTHAKGEALVDLEYLASKYDEEATAALRSAEAAKALKASVDHTAALTAGEILYERIRSYRMAYLDRIKAEGTVLGSWDKYDASVAKANAPHRRPTIEQLADVLHPKGAA